jgi:integrase
MATASERRRLMDRLLETGLAPKSAALYSAEIDRAQRWCEENGTTLETITASEIVEFLNSRPRSWSTRKLIKSALDHYWRITERHNPPIGAVKMPRRPRMRCRALTEEEAALLEEVARARVRRGDPKGLVVLLGLYLGLRREEIASLTWDVFDGTFVTIFGKGGTCATLPVHPVLVEALEAIPREGRWVFPGRYGRQWATPASIWNWCREVSLEAGIDPVSTHRLRHTCLATALDATGDLRAVQEFARHASPVTTAGYTRVTTKRLLAVMVSLDYDQERRS